MGTYNFHLLEKHTPRSIGLEEYSIGWRERSLNKYLSSKYKPNIFLPQSHTSNLANHSTREEEPLQLAQTIELKLDISIALRSPVFVHVDDDNSKFKVKRWRPEMNKKRERETEGGIESELRRGWQRSKWIWWVIDLPRWLSLALSDTRAIIKPWSMGVRTPSRRQSGFRVSKVAN